MIKIYFDLDGVLADFNRGLRELCGIEPVTQGASNEAKDDELWKAVRETDHFYDRLKPVDGAVWFFRRLYEKYDCEILTGVPKPKRGVVTASVDKIAWAHRVLDPKVKVNTVMREEKIGFCKGPNDILIDDYKKNVDEWNANGGTGILFTDVESAEKELKAVLGC